MMKILIVEDEPRLANIIRRGLIEDGFQVDVAYDGKEGLRKGESNEYDLNILDVMLPKTDGLTVCRELRNKNIKTPILIFTSRSSFDDKVEGFNSGADDYMTKPFSFLELKSRVHALIRRDKQEYSPILKISDLKLNTVRHSVLRGENSIKLTPKEFSILELLIRYKDEVVTRNMIFENVWNYNFEGMSNIVDVYVASLRNKIDKVSKMKLIHTIHGLGFKISDESD